MTAANELQTILRQVSAILTELDIRHHFTGGIAVTVYGEPRLTQDVDVVVELTSGSPKVELLKQKLGELFQINESAISDAILRNSIFQALHNELFIKVDFHVGETIPGAFERSTTVELADDLQVKMVSREDAILSKLIWIKKGSERSKRDVVMMLRGAKINTVFVEKMAKTLGVENIWSEIKDQAINCK